MITDYKYILEGIGAGKMIKDPNYQETSKKIQWFIENHGLRKYDLFPGFTYPVINPDQCYVRSERGYRVYNRRVEYHEGIDIVSKYNFSVLSVTKGQVIKTGYNKIYGNYLIVKTGHYRIKYSHLSNIIALQGLTVMSGEKIGIMGSTGRADGVHLDLEISFLGRLKNFVTNSTYQKEVEE
jgi:murein DD-endopeptidase MepM/ murein hydrolase activator NlpD